MAVLFGDRGWLSTVDSDVVEWILISGFLSGLFCLLMSQEVAVVRFSRLGYTIVIGIILLFLHCIPQRLPMLFIHWVVVAYLLMRTPPWRYPGWLVMGMTCLYIFPTWIREWEISASWHVVETILVGGLMGCLLFLLQKIQTFQFKLISSMKSLVDHLHRMAERVQFLHRGVMIRRQVPMQSHQWTWMEDGHNSRSFLVAVDAILQQESSSPYHILCLDQYSWRLLVRRWDLCLAPEGGKSGHGGGPTPWQQCLPKQALVAPDGDDRIVIGFLGTGQQLKLCRETLIHRLHYCHRHHGYQGDFLRLPACIGAASYPREGRASLDLVQLARKRLDTQRRYQWRREVERQRQLEKLSSVGQLAAGLAHEIRNPLTSIRGFLQIAAAESVSLKKWESIMLGEMDRINDLLRQFLKLSETKPVRFHRFLLDQLMHDVLSLLRPKAFLMGHELEALSPGYLVELVADAERIKQVLINLIQNALEAFQRKGKVEIRWSKQHDQAVIQIGDDGNGIDQVNLTRIFDPFFTTKREGTGMGLAVCQRIVQDHGGQIHVTSRMGVGTTFTIHLPLTKRHMEPLPAVTQATFPRGLANAAFAWASYESEVQ
ncbi:ATP-binding protein [Pasteuria penetrans]|uniref:ATP-binding protein n=1 Tax=Pasteuria penetrans TaxID=86005 RepID=UPI000FB190E7|nr:ATP-binding protein [Pasteuria penetrans]